MDLNTNLLDRIVSKNPDLGKTDQSIFPASNELDEEESGVNDSGIDVLDLSTPSKQLKSAVFVPETPRYSTCCRVYFFINCSGIIFI